MLKTKDKYYRELRITHRFLSESGLDVPRQLLLQLSQMICDEQQKRRERKLSRATEEQLLRLNNKSLHTLRVVMADGMLLRGATNIQTYIDTLQDIGLDRLREYDFRCGKHPILIYDPTLRRRRISGYYYMRPGYFLRRLKDARSMVDVLTTIDRALQLNMDIVLE